MKKVIKAPLLLSILLLSSFAVHAVDLNLADKPLAVVTEGVSPNVLLILDESGSMNGSDVFYSPGFDGNKVYGCSSASTANILKPLAGNTVVVNVSKSAGTNGMPYFQYNGKFHTWGGNNITEIDGIDMDGGQVCFDTEEEYKVKLLATEQPKYCTQWWYKTSTSWGATTYYSNTGCPQNNKSCGCNTQAFYPYLTAENSTRVETLTGSYLNWYFSKTESKMSDVTLDGGYTNYGEGGTNHIYWTEDFDTDFNVTSSSASKNSFGLKKGVSYKHVRLEVAIDVIKTLIRDTNKAFLAYMGYTTRSGSDLAAKLTLRNGAVEFDNDNLEATNLKKEVMLEKVHNTVSAGGTPTGKAILAAFAYLFNGFENTKFKFGNSTTADQSISSMSGNFKYATNTNTPGNKGNTPLITDAKYCQKNAFVVLTDGRPSVDAALSTPLKDYKPKGLTQTEFNSLPTSTSNAIGYEQPRHRKDLVSITGALHDHDFLPDMEGKQNVDTFMIGFGNTEVLTDYEFKLAGKAGGGGVENFYPASDGAAIAQAFKDIFARIQASAASVTAIAVSAVSELKTENFAIQATYQTEYWSSELKAFRLNKEGQFINAADDPEGAGTDSSAGKIPVWEANSVLNSKYLIDSANKKSVKTRKVYTWDAGKGVRFGSDTMTRPINSTAGFSAFNALPEKMKNDLKMRAGTNTQEQYDLMMYLLGDITHEIGFTGAEKYHRRGVYGLDSSNKVTSIQKGGFLGDIASSSPIYVKEPPRPWDDKNYGTANAPYSAYKTEQKDRTAMVYVGTNRGFLHGIAVEGSDAGSEVFAYMPNALSSTAPGKGYHYLASKKYEHRFYVDLTPTISDVFMDFYSDAATEKNAEWRTILVGGLRAGGKGYFALDITCPFKTSNGSTCDDESFNDKNVLWEFSDVDDADLGFTYGEPVITRVFYDRGLQDSNRHGEEKGRWAAIVSNGYNSINGRAALFVLFLDGGLDGTWTEGVDYIKLYAGSATDDTPDNKNGLSSATVIDLDGDGIADHIYAGDLKGQMWSFDVTQSVVYQEATP